MNKKLMERERETSNRAGMRAKVQKRWKRIEPRGPVAAMAEGLREDFSFLIGVVTEMLQMY